MVEQLWLIKQLIVPRLESSADVRALSRATVIAERFMASRDLDRVLWAEANDGTQPESHSGRQSFVNRMRMARGTYNDDFILKNMIYRRLKDIPADRLMGACFRRCRDGRTIAHIAARDGNVELLRRALMINRDIVDIHDDNDVSPLETAIVESKITCAHTLIDAGADIHHPCTAHNNASLLWMALSNGMYGVAKRLVSLGARVRPKLSDESRDELGEVLTFF